MIIELSITNKCNLRCKYCFEKNDIKKGMTLYDTYITNQNEDMTNEVAFDAIDFFTKYAVERGDNFLQVDFFGGEPLLRPDFIKDVVSHCEDKYQLNQDFKYIFSLTTNGTIFTEEIFDFLKQKNFSLMISIDGTRSAHDMNRVDTNNNGSFDLVEKNMNHILNYIKNEKIMIKMVVSPNNVKYLFDSVRFLSKFNIKISFDINYETIWCQNDYDEFKNQITKVIQHYSEICINNTSIFEIDNRRFLGGKSLQSYCEAGKNFYHITTKGNIFPCSKFPSIEKYMIGTVKEGFNENHKLFLDYSYLNTSCKDCKMYSGSKCHCLYLNCLYNDSIVEKVDLVCNMERTINYVFLKNYDDIKQVLQR